MLDVGFQYRTSNIQHPTSSTIQLNRADDFFEIVLDLNSAVGKLGAGDAAAAEYVIEFVLIVRMVRDGGRRVFQLVASEDAHDALVWRDDAFLTQHLGAGDTGRAGGLAAQTVGADLCFGVEHLLIGHFANNAVHALKCAEAFV